MGHSSPDPSTPLPGSGSLLSVFHLSVVMACHPGSYFVVASAGWQCAVGMTQQLWAGTAVAARAAHVPPVPSPLVLTCSLPKAQLFSHCHQVQVPADAPSLPTKGKGPPAVPSGAGDGRPSTRVPLTAARRKSCGEPGCSRMVWGRALTAEQQEPSGEAARAHLRTRCHPAGACGLATGTRISMEITGSNSFPLTGAV